MRQNNCIGEVISYLSFRAGVLSLKYTKDNIHHVKLLGHLPSNYQPSCSAPSLP